MGVAITTQVYLCLSSSVNGLSSHFVVTVRHFFSKEPTTPFRDGPLQNLWGGGGGRAKYKKNIPAREN